MAALKIVIKQIKSDTRTALGTTRKRVRVPGLRINMKERGIDRHRVSLDLSFCWTSTYLKPDEQTCGLVCYSFRPVLSLSCPLMAEAIEDSPRIIPNFHRIIVY